jgi:hypothetical protein
MEYFEAQYFQTRFRFYCQGRCQILQLYNYIFAVERVACVILCGL